MRAQSTLLVLSKGDRTMFLRSTLVAIVLVLAAADSASAQVFIRGDANVDSARRVQKLDRVQT